MITTPVNNAPLSAPVGNAPVWEKVIPSSAPGSSSNGDMVTLSRSARPVSTPLTETNIPATAVSGSDAGDAVARASSPRLLDDSEVKSVLQETVGMIHNNVMEALSAHGGFNAARVAALLA